MDAAAAAAEVAAALESEALASALRATDFERQLRLAAEAAAAEARQVPWLRYSLSARPVFDKQMVLTDTPRLDACMCNAAIT